MSPREATQTDPMHRLGLSSAYEALEMAGYVPNRSPSTRLERIGTFYGQTSDDWREINEAQEIDTYFITAGVRAFAPVSHDPKTSSTNILYILNHISGENKLLFQVQWSQLQRRYRLFFQCRSHAVGLYFSMGR